MSAFIGPLRAEFGDWGKDIGRMAMLLEPLVWHCDEIGSESIVTVPAGYVTDGASVPRLLWVFLPPWGNRATRAAILHDWICDELKAGRPLPSCETRAGCDRQFRLALIALGVHPAQAGAAWLGVRAYSIWEARFG